MVSSSIVPSIRSTDANVNAASPSSLARRKDGLSEETTAPIRSARMSWACSSSTSARYPVYPEMSAIRKQVGWAVESMCPCLASPSSEQHRSKATGVALVFRDCLVDRVGLPSDRGSRDHLGSVDDQERVPVDDTPVGQGPGRRIGHREEPRIRRVHE